jgi:NAD+ synthase (glutamine-hydrolysing)
LQPLKICTAQLNYHTGNFEHNTAKIIAAIQQARAQQCDLIVFSELSVCGYPPRDFLEFSDFIEQCKIALDEIASNCKDIAAVVGAPSVNPVLEGKDLYNSAYFLSEGKIQKIIHKTLLPNYDIFDEYRYFEPNHEFECVTYKGYKLAITICEDLWNVDDNPMYRQSPMEELKLQQPHAIINIAASPYSQKQLETRHEVLLKNVSRYSLPLLYVNMTGAQTHLIFDGGSMVINATGEVIDRHNHFSEDFGYYELLGKELSVLQKHLPYKPLPLMEQIRLALITGIREYFYKQGFKKCIIGLSGGIDSAVVTALAVQALGNDNVRVLLLPSRYSSEHSVTDSIEMCNRLGIQYDIISIADAYSIVESTLQKQFEGTAFGIAEENIQSRLRGLLLMAMSNKFGYILLNTSNKSELAVGYGTLYGDMCGGLSVIGDLYKTQVYELAYHINSISNCIPIEIINKEPSAELRPDQKDSDSLPPYEMLDKILYAYIEERMSPRQIIDLTGEEALVKRVLKMVNSNEWKRLQAPPVLRVSTKAFGPGRRMPIVAKYLS